MAETAPLTSASPAAPKSASEPPVFPVYTFEVLSVRQIRALIHSEVKHDWWRAIRTIDKLADQALRKELLKELSTCMDEYVRQSCLSMLQDRSLLLDALKNDPSAWVRRNAVLVLQKIGGDGTFEALLQAAHDEDLYVRVNVAAALVQLGRPTVAADLIRSLESSLTNPDDAVRYDAVDNIAALKTEAAVPPLVRALRDENREIRDIAARGLITLDASGLIPLLENLAHDPDARVAEAAKEILEQKAQK